MAKRSKENVQEDIKKLLDELRINARESLSTLAKKLNFSRQKIWKMINLLEKEKKIWGYSAVIDDKAIGYNQYFILLKRTYIPASTKLLEIISSRVVKNQLDELNINIIGSYYVNGDYDWVIIVNARNTQQVKATVDVFFNQLREYISKVRILEVLYPLEKSGIENPNPEKIQEFF